MGNPKPDHGDHGPVESATPKGSGVLLTLGKQYLTRLVLTSYSSSSIGTRTQFTVCALPVFAESSEARASASPFAG